MTFASKNVKKTLATPSSNLQGRSTSKMIGVQQSKKKSTPPTVQHSQKKSHISPINPQTPENPPLHHILSGDHTFS